MKMRITSFDAIGTKWTIDAVTDLSEGEWNTVLDAIQDRIAQFDKNYSRFRKDSLITKMSKKAGSYIMPDDGYTLFKFYETLYGATNGLVTPLIGDVMNRAGYDADYSLKVKSLKKALRWEKVLEYSKSEIKLRRPTMLDFGAAGKGYLIDIVSNLLIQRGIETFVVNAGGDISHRSSESQSIEVGLENPLNTSEILGTVELNNRSLCASAGTRRAWGKFHHIIDPEKLRSPDDILATWVIADDTMTADGLSTALFFCDPKELSLQFKFGFALLNKDMSMNHSDNFPARFFGTEK